MDTYGITNPPSRYNGVLRRIFKKTNGIFPREGITTGMTSEDSGLGWWRPLEPFCQQPYPPRVKGDIEGKTILVGPLLLNP